MKSEGKKDAARTGATVHGVNLGVGPENRTAGGVAAHEKPRRIRPGSAARDERWTGIGRPARGDRPQSIADPSPQLVDAVHQLLDGLALELADALAGQAQVLAHLAEGHRLERLPGPPPPGH